LTCCCDKVVGNIDLTFLSPDDGSWIAQSSLKRGSLKGAVINNHYAW
jgi:hypothetical protein